MIKVVALNRWCILVWFPQKGEPEKETWVKVCYWDPAGRSKGQEEWGKEREKATQRFIIIFITVTRSWFLDFMGQFKEPWENLGIFFMEEKETFIYQLPSLLVKKPLPSGVISLNFWVDHLWTKSKLLETLVQETRCFQVVVPWKMLTPIEDSCSIAAKIRRRWGWEDSKGCPSGVNCRPPLLPVISVHAIHSVSPIC